MSRRLFAFGLFRADLNKQTARGLFPPAVFSHTRRVFHRGRRASFVAPGVCSVLWRAGRGSTRSVFHRAGCILRSIHAPDARGRFLRSAAFNIHNTPFKSLRMLKVFSVYWARTQNVFHHTVGFHRSVARRTREVTPTVPGTECHPSRRGFCPFCGCSAAVSRHFRNCPVAVSRRVPSFFIRICF